MPKHSATAFKKELYHLFDHRVHWLLRAIGGTSTKRPPQFNRSKVDRSIAKLQALASDCIADIQAKREFLRLVTLKKQWHICGHGVDNKKANFAGWFKQTISGAHYIYIFWGRDKKCLYVGKTEKGKGRPENHFNTYWFRTATRIDIYSVKSATEVLKIECLAKHRFSPAYNKIDPPTKKWYKKCPVCAVHTLIHDEMRRIFGIKKS